MIFVGVVDARDAEHRVVWSMPLDGCSGIVQGDEGTLLQAVVDITRSSWPVTPPALDTCGLQTGTLGAVRSRAATIAARNKKAAAMAEETGGSAVPGGGGGSATRRLAAIGSKASRTFGPADIDFSAACGWRKTPGGGPTDAGEPLQKAAELMAFTFCHPPSRAPGSEDAAQELCVVHSAPCGGFLSFVVGFCPTFDDELASIGDDLLINGAAVGAMRSRAPFCWPSGAPSDPATGIESIVLRGDPVVMELLLVDFNDLFRVHCMPGYEPLSALRKHQTTGRNSRSSDAADERGGGRRQREVTAESLTEGLPQLRLAAFRLFSVLQDERRLKLRELDDPEVMSVATAP